MRHAKTAALKAGVHAYMDRKKKKRVNRTLWNIQVNAAVREHGMTYSKFIAALKKNKIELDRKVLAELAIKYPEVFKEVVENTLKYLEASRSDLTEEAFLSTR